LLPFECPRRDSAAAAGESDFAAAMGKAQSRKSHPRPAASRLSGRAAPVLYRTKPRRSLWHNQQKPADTSEQDFSGDAATGIVQFDLGGHDGAVAGDLSVSDIHFHAWVSLVAGIVLFWFLYVWQRGSLR
jgi:hypothetical protein